MKEMPADQERIITNLSLKTKTRRLCLDAKISVADAPRWWLGLYLDYKEDSHKKGPDTAKINDFAYNIDQTLT